LRPDRAGHAANRFPVAQLKENPTVNKLRVEKTVAIRSRPDGDRYFGAVYSRRAMTPSSAPLALDGVRVVDLSRVLAGPYCGALLGDLGADVIKVEDPGVGDESRTWPPHKDGESAGYLVNNRNKRGIAVNLKEPDGVAIVRRL